MSLPTTLFIVYLILISLFILFLKGQNISNNQILVYFIITTLVYITFIVLTNSSVIVNYNSK